FLLTALPPRSTLFPYTTLFRSSTLARRFGELVGDECGAMVLTGRCYERESVPYKALDGLIDSLTGLLARVPALDIAPLIPRRARSEEHTSELQSRSDLVCRLLL